MRQSFVADKFRKENAKDFGGLCSSDEPNDLIDLSIGDPDMTTSGVIIDAAMRDAHLGHTHYTDRAGYPELRAEIAKFYSEEYGYTVLPENIYLVTGACHGTYLLMQAMLDPGDEVIVSEPYFAPYLDDIKFAGGVPVALPVLPDGTFDFNIEAFEKAITKKTKAVIINTPNNPTGICYDAETLRQITKIAQKHDIAVLTDEVYSTITAEKFTPVAATQGCGGTIITINSFSKCSAMTGWRVGYLIAPKDLIACMIRINDCICYTVPSVSQRAALAALRSRKLVMPQIRREFVSRTGYVYSRIEKIPLFSAPKPQGGIYVFMNFAKTGLDSEEFCEKLFKETHVKMIPGNRFGKSCDSSARIACTVSPDKLREAFDRIEGFARNFVHM